MLMASRLFCFWVMVRFKVVFHSGMRNRVFNGAVKLFDLSSYLDTMIPPMGIRQLKGMIVAFQDECEGVIKEENEDSILIESSFFTGWMSKVEFWEMWGTEEGPLDLDAVPA